MRTRKDSGSTAAGKRHSNCQAHHCLSNPVQEQLPRRLFIRAEAGFHCVPTAIPQVLRQYPGAASSLAQRNIDLPNGKCMQTRWTDVHASCVETHIENRPNDQPVVCHACSLKLFPVVTALVCCHRLLRTLCGQTFLRWRSDGCFCLGLGLRQG